MTKEPMSIRSILYNEMEQKGFNLSQFSKYCDINRGTLSQILNGKPSQLPSIADLDRLALVTTYSREQLYELYIEECFAKDALHGKRMKNVLYRCVELNLYSIIQKIMERLLDYPSQSKSVYDMAEHWYDEGQRQMLIPLYEYVTVSEKYRNSDRIAISRYRIFQLSQTNNFEQNLHAAIIFEPYRHELPIAYRLDGLLKLTNVYFNQHMWKKVEQFADELRELATSAYEYRLHMVDNVDGERGVETERHLVVYYGHGYLLKGNALEKQGLYEEAMNYIEGYRDLSWFDGLDACGKIEVEKFKNFAHANELNLYVLMGHTDKLNEYVDFLEQHPMEIIPGLLTIIYSANKYHFLIDDILLLFESEIEKMEQNRFLSNSHYSEIFDLDHYTDLCIELGVYYFRTNNYNKAVDVILKSLRVSRKISNNKNTVTAIALLHSFRNNVTLLQCYEYDKWISEVLENENIKVDCMFDS